MIPPVPHSMHSPQTIEPSELTPAAEMLSRAARVSQAAGMPKMVRMVKTTTTTTEVTVTIADTSDQFEGPTIQPADSGDVAVRHDEGAATGGEMRGAQQEEQEDQEIQLQDMPDLEMLLEDEELEWVLLSVLFSPACLASA